MPPGLDGICCEFKQSATQWRGTSCTQTWFWAIQCSGATSISFFIFCRAFIIAAFLRSRTQLIVATRDVPKTSWMRNINYVLCIYIYIYVVEIYDLTCTCLFAGREQGSIMDYCWGAFQRSSHPNPPHPGWACPASRQHPDQKVSTPGAAFSHQCPSIHQLPNAWHSNQWVTRIALHPSVEINPTA